MGAIQPLFRIKKLVIDVSLSRNSYFFIDFIKYYEISMNLEKDLNIFQELNIRILSKTFLLLKKILILLRN